MKKYNQFIKESLDESDEDFDYLNKMLGGEEDDPKDDESLEIGDKITYYRQGSENNEKSGVFVGIREDGKYRLVFDDGKKFVCDGKNVYKYGQKPAVPKKVKKLYNIIPEDKLGRDKWGPGAFDMPDTFLGAKGAPEINKNPMKFKKGEKIVYRNVKSEHNGKKGIFVKQREDGKVSILFEDGIKFAANPKNVISISSNLSKNSFYFKIENKDGAITATAFHNGEEGKWRKDESKISNMFPELIDMEFEEFLPGQLKYHGELEFDELIDQLEVRDFITQI
jgi:hypothetical protein